MENKKARDELGYLHKQKAQMREDWDVQAKNDRQRKEHDETERKKKAHMSVGPQVPPVPTMEEAVMKTLMNAEKRKETLTQIE